MGMPDREEIEDARRVLSEWAQDYAQRKGTSSRNRNTDAVLRAELHRQGLEDLLQKYPMPAPLPYKGKKSKKIQRVVNVMLSDLHYGSDLRAAECGSVYGPTEEARRTAAVAEAVADWKRHYRPETTLYVHLIGDIVAGKLHDPQTGAPQTEQFFRAVWNLRQALVFLASEYQHVTVFTSPGNHGRRKERHSERAVNQKWDSHENDIYVALKIALAGTPNLDVVIAGTPYYIYEALDTKGFMTHGDTVLQVGFPGSAIQVEKARRQINEINVKHHCDVFGVGHVHTASMTRLPNGPMLITNGCLLPSDEYAQSRGIMNTACCQQIWETVPGRAVGHRMDITVDSITDARKELDRIVKPAPNIHTFGAARGYRG